MHTPPLINPNLKGGGWDTTPARPPLCRSQRHVFLRYFLRPYIIIYTPRESQAGDKELNAHATIWVKGKGGFALYKLGNNIEHIVA